MFFLVVARQRGISYLASIALLNRLVWPSSGSAKIPIRFLTGDQNILVMKKITRLFCILSAVALLAMVSSGCSAKAKAARHLKKADALFAAGQYEAAELEYVNVLRFDHENARAINQMGTIYFEGGRLQKAVPFLFKAHEMATNDVDVCMKLASFYLVAGKPKEAREQALFVLAQRPQDKQAPSLLVATADSEKMLAETKQRLQAQAQKSDSVGVELALWNLAFRSRDMAGAEAALKRAQALDPKWSAVWSAVGAMYLAQSNRVQAEAALKQAAELAPDRSDEKLQYAQFQSQLGDTAACLKLIEAMTVKTPDYIPAWMALAQLAASERKYDESSKALDRVLKLDGDNFSALMMGGQLKLTQGQTAEATAVFERMAKLFNKAPSAHYQLAVAYVAGNQTEKAIASLNTALGLNTNYTEATLMLDELEIRRGNGEVAIPSLKLLAQRYPQTPQVQMLLAQAYRSRGGYDDALAVYQHLQGLYPTNSEIPAQMGAVYVQQRKFDAARTALSQAFSLNPEDFSTLEQLVGLNLRDKQFAEAMQLVQTQLAKRPDVVGLKILKAQVLIAQGDVKLAEAELAKMAASSQDTDITHMLLARLAMDSKQNPKALAELKLALEKNPKNADALMVMGMIESEQQNYKASADAYEKLLVLNPKSSGALNNLAYIYSEYLGNLERAYDLAQQARAILDNDPSAGDTLGWILAKRGQYQSAIALLQESAGQLPAEPEAQFHLGWTLYMMGQEATAQAVLQRTMQLNKPFRGQDEGKVCLAVLLVDPASAGKDAMAMLEKRATDQPGDSIALIRLAMIYQRNGAIDKAIAAYEAALKASPQNVPAMFSLSQLYSNKNNPQKALELARAASKIAPDNLQVSYLLGQLAYENGDYKLSANILQDVARNQPNNPDVQFMYAKAAYAMGQVADAQAAAGMALQTDAKFAGAAEAKMFLSLTALTANTPSAETMAQAVLKTNPDYVPALMVLALLDEKKGDFTLANQIYMKVLALYPNFAPAQRNLAILLASGSENDPQAFDVATKARAAYPDDQAIAKALGIILYRKADYTRAERILKESADTTPSDPEIYYFLGMTQYQLKKSIDCKKSLQKAVTLNLADRYIAETKRVLAELK